MPGADALDHSGDHGHSAAWRPAAPRNRRIVRTARGLRVFAVMVGVAIVSSRSSGRYSGLL